MPYGSGPIIRHALQRATPWQRALVTAAMLGGGVMLVLFGHVAGVLLAGAGALLLWRTVRDGRRGSQGAPARVQRGGRP